MSTMEPNVDSPIEHRQTFNTISTFKCFSCRENRANYRCPGCSTPSCSLPCVNKHKRLLDCDGIRNRVQFRRLPEMTNLDVLSDYRFLEEIARRREGAVRNRRRFSRPKSGPKFGSKFRQGTRLDSRPKSALKTRCHPESPADNLPETLLESLPETRLESLPETRLDTLSQSEVTPEDRSKLQLESHREAIPESIPESMPETDGESRRVGFAEKREDGGAGESGEKTEKDADRIPLPDSPQQKQ